MNAILRRKQGISAYKLYTARSQDTGSNLQLDDAQLYTDQLTAKESIPQLQPRDIQVGDTVTSVA